MNSNNNTINKSIPRHAGDGLRNISLHMVFPGITVNLNNFIRNFLHGRPDKQDLKNLTKVDIQKLLTCAGKKIMNFSKCHKDKAVEIVLENWDDIQTSLRLKVNASVNASGQGAPTNFTTASRTTINNEQYQQQQQNKFLPGRCQHASLPLER